MVSEQLFERRCLWPKTSCRELPPALYLPHVTSWLPLKGEFVPGCLHQGTRHMLWSPGQSMSSRTQLEGADHASFVCSWVGLWPGALQYQQAGTSSRDGVWLSAFVNSPCCKTSQALGWMEVARTVHPPPGGTVCLQAFRECSLFLANFDICSYGL